MNKLLRQEYYFSLSERDRILPRLQILQVFYIAVLTTMIYMLRNIDYSIEFSYVALFFFLLFIVFMLVIISIWLFIKALSGYEYKIISKSKDMLKYKEELKQYKEEIKNYNNVNNENIELPKIKIKLNIFIDEIIAECTDKNKEINNKRMVLFRNSLTFLLGSIAFLFFSGMVYIILGLDASSPRKVNISLDANSPIVKTLEKINIEKDTTMTENRREEISEALKEQEQSIILKEKIQKVSVEQKNELKTTQKPKEPEKPNIQISNESAIENKNKNNVILEKDK